MMDSLQNLFRIGTGPSASHTMGPRRAAERFRERSAGAGSYRVILYGSLAATGKGHLTDQALRETLAPAPLEIIWRPETQLPRHANGMELIALDEGGEQIAFSRVYSTGGGAFIVDDEESEARQTYAISTMNGLLEWTEATGNPLWAYVPACEGEGIWEFLGQVWEAMSAACRRGISTSGVLPGSLRLLRRSSSYYAKARWLMPELQRSGLVAAYALGVSEENAAGGVVATAPTCGASGVLPAVLYYFSTHHQYSQEDILRGLATAGLIGNLVKTNASISGAEVGCQGEVGTACAMAAGAVTQLLGGTPRQIEYAAEMGIEHHLGLTCDPVAGLVQIPCIERNAVAAMRAIDCAIYALLSDGSHRVSFDDVVMTMWSTGKDLLEGYRETAGSGLAAVFAEEHCGG